MSKPLIGKKNKMEVFLFLFLAIGDYKFGKRYKEKIKKNLSKTVFVFFNFD